MEDHPMKEKIKIIWSSEPEKKDYPAAKSYLNLFYSHRETVNITNRLEKAPVKYFKAKDIFRASELSLLGVSNSHVEKDQKKIKKGEALSPILLVREKSLQKLIIADGYHRLCAVYSFNEDELIPCKIVSSYKI
jgi:disulfide oxidoreductase YuzD